MDIEGKRRDEMKRRGNQKFLCCLQLTATVAMLLGTNPPPAYGADVVASNSGPHSEIEGILVLNIIAQSLSKSFQLSADHFLHPLSHIKYYTEFLAISVFDLYKFV